MAIGSNEGQVVSIVRGPPAAPPAGDGDPFWDDVVFLAGFDSGDGAQMFQNEAAVSSSILTQSFGSFNFTGTAQLDTAEKKFGDSSLLLDGNSDLVALTDNISGVQWDLWTFKANEPFTIDAWVYPVSSGSGTEIVTHYTATGSQRDFRLVRSAASRLNFVSWQGDTTQNFNLLSDADDDIPQDTWTHVAATRDSGGTVRIFVNGVVQSSTASFSGAFFNSNATLRIGAVDSGGLTAFWDGWLDEVRILKGAAAWTGTFTVPSAEYARDSSDPNWFYTTVLAGFNGADAATAFANEAFPMDFVADAQIDTAQSFDGAGGSALFDGTGDVIMIPKSTSWRFPTSTPFTIEAFVRRSGTGVSEHIVSFYQTTGDERSWTFGINASDLLGFTWSSNGNSTTSIIATDTIGSGTWTHVAATRDNTDTFRIFVGGVVQADTASSSVASRDATASLRIGASGTFTTTHTNLFNGWIDEVRITMGAARYTGNFTPPTAPFPRG